MPISLAEVSHIKYVTDRIAIHEEANSNLADLRRLIEGMNLIKPTLTGDEIEEHHWYLKSLVKDEQELAEKEERARKARKGAETRTALIERAREAVNEKQQ